jgi:hypothetical protein
VDAPDIPGGLKRGVESRRDPVSHQCPKTGSDALDEATQTRHAKRPDHYLCDTVEQLFTHLSFLGVKWSQVQILSARPRKWRLSCGDRLLEPQRWFGLSLLGTTTSSVQAPGAPLSDGQVGPPTTGNRQNHCPIRSICCRDRKALAELAREVLGIET